MGVVTYFAVLCVDRHCSVRFLRDFLDYRRCHHINPCEASGEINVLQLVMNVLQLGMNVLKCN